MPDASPLTVKRWLSQGWTAYRKYPLPLIGGAVILSIFSLFFTLLQGIPWGSLIGPIGGVVINSVLQAGWCMMCLQSVRGESVGSLDIFNGFSRLIPVWMTFFLLFLIVTGGCLLLVVPGIIWGLKYGMSIFAVMDGKLTARESIRLSGKITRGYKGKLFGQFLIAIVLGLPAYPFYMGLGSPGHGVNPTLLMVGAIPYVIETVIILPFVTSAFAAAYDGLARREELPAVPIHAQGAAAPLTPGPPMIPPPSVRPPPP